MRVCGDTLWVRKRSHQRPLQYHDWNQPTVMELTRLNLSRQKTECGTPPGALARLRLLCLGNQVTDRKNSRVGAEDFVAWNDRCLPFWDSCQISNVVSRMNSSRMSIPIESRKELPDRCLPLKQHSFWHERLFYPSKTNAETPRICIERDKDWLIIHSFSQTHSNAIIFL